MRAWSGHESLLRLKWRCVGKTERHDHIADLKKCMKTLEATDFGRQHEWLRSSFKVIALGVCELQGLGVHRLLQAFHLDFANRVRDPLCSAGLTGVQKNLARRLGQ